MIEQFYADLSVVPESKFECDLLTDAKQKVHCHGAKICDKIRGFWHHQPFVKEISRVAKNARSNE